MIAPAVTAAAPSTPGARARTRLTCLAVRAETPTVKTFVLAPEDPGFLSFEAGQAVSLILDVGGKELVRTFSIASAPGSEAIEVTIKRHAEGRATRWLHETVEAGSVLSALPPRGRFTLGAEAGRPLALVSAGSGATPLMSMLRHLSASGPGLDVAWHHTASSPDEILFAAELAAMQARHPGLTVTMAVSRPAPGWFGFRGRPTRRLLTAAVPDIGRRAVFACGPTGFMREVQLVHAAEGGVREAFHMESFGGPDAAAEAVRGAPAAGEAGPLAPLDVDGRRIEVSAGETILQAALRNGVVIPCGCGQGLCGTCVVRGLSGAFRMEHQGGLSPEEESEGLLLACSTRIAGPASISLR